VTIKLVLVYVKVTTPPETVLVSVIGQREVEVVYTTFTALVVTAGRVVLILLARIAAKKMRELTMPQWW